MKKIIVLLLITVVFVNPGFTQDMSPVDAIVDAVGGMDALADLSSFTIEATIERFSTGESMSPDDGAVPASTYDAVVNYDISGDNLRIDYQRTTGFNDAMFSVIIAGDLGYMEGNDGRFGAPARNLAADRLGSSKQQQRLLNPHLILLDALADSAMVSDGGTADVDGVEHHVLIVADVVTDVTLFANAETGLISKLETMENDHWLRDVDLDVTYSDWRDAGGVMFPNEVTIAVNGEVVHHETRSSVSTNGDVDSALFEFPEDAEPVADEGLTQRGQASSQVYQLFSSIGFPQEGPLQTFVNAEEIADGVFFLTGGSHNSLAIEQENGIVLSDAPLYEARSEAIIAWAAEQFPGKSITHVIVSHHHRDHSSGLRTFVANGATIILGEESLDRFSQVFSAPSTIMPDALAENPVDAVIETVPADGMLELADGMHTIVVYPLETSHAADFTITYIPDAEIAWFVDVQPTSDEAQAGLAALGIPVSLFANGHGGTAPAE